MRPPSRLRPAADQRASLRTVRPPPKLRLASEQRASLRPKSRAISKRSDMAADPFGSTAATAHKDGAPKLQDFVLPVRNIALQ
eukprot:COSAG01_NODE_52073_length_349_cov_1.032000_1_plen_82_part_10